MNRRENRRNGINPSTNETLSPSSINRIIHRPSPISPSFSSSNRSSRSSLWCLVWRLLVISALPIFTIWILPSILPSSALFFANAHPVNRVISMVPPTISIMVEDQQKEEIDGPEGEEDEVPERVDGRGGEDGRADGLDGWIPPSRQEGVLDLDYPITFPHKQLCSYSVCSETTLFTYRRCCRNDIYSCCWFFRMWVIVVFGIFALKLFLTIFVSFFRCVCC